MGLFWNYVFIVKFGCFEFLIEENFFLNCFWCYNMELFLGVKFFFSNIFFVWLVYVVSNIVDLLI